MTQILEGQDRFISRTNSELYPQVASFVHKLHCLFTDRCSLPKTIQARVLLISRKESQCCSHCTHRAGKDSVLQTVDGLVHKAWEEAVPDFIIRQSEKEKKVMCEVWTPVYLPPWNGKTKTKTFSMFFLSHQYLRFFPPLKIMKLSQEQFWCARQLRNYSRCSYHWTYFVWNQVSIITIPNKA